MREGTPFLHVAAGAGIWYLVIVARSIVGALNTRTGWDGVVPALVDGGILFAVTTTVTWLILLRRRLKAWTLIPFTVPIYIAVAIVIGLITSPG
ncbi:hypothetical protein ACWGE0_15820 [Lentzea sp. NPDC054927]